MDGEILVRAACQIRWNKLQGRDAELSKLWMSRHVFVPIFVPLNSPLFRCWQWIQPEISYFFHKYFILCPSFECFLLLLKILSSSISQTFTHLVWNHTQWAVRCLPLGTKSSSSCKRWNLRAWLGDLSWWESDGLEILSLLTAKVSFSILHIWLSNQKLYGTKACMGQDLG